MDEALQSEPQPAKRAGGVRVNGKFAPGHSGNPGGRSQRMSDGRTLRELCRDMSEDAVRVLHSYAMDPKAPPELRVTCARELLARGWADAPRKPDGIPEGGITYVVQPINIQGGPVPGVIASPITAHIALSPRNVIDAQELTPADMEAGHA